MSLCLRLFGRGRTEAPDHLKHRSGPRAHQWIRFQARRAAHSDVLPFSTTLSVCDTRAPSLSLRVSCAAPSRPLCRRRRQCGYDIQQAGVVGFRQPGLRPLQRRNGHRSGHRQRARGSDSFLAARREEWMRVDGRGTAWSSRAAAQARVRAGVPQEGQQIHEMGRCEYRSNRARNGSILRSVRVSMHAKCHQNL